MTELTTYADLMERREALVEELANLDAEIDEVKEIARQDVEKGGDIYSSGYHAGFKPGRSRTDHEAAAKAANVPSFIITKYSTTKTTVAWAKVTKTAKVDTSNFVVTGTPVFFIEKVE